MAQATLNPAIEGLKPSSILYDLYTRFYDGLFTASQVDTPDFVTNPIYKKNADGSYAEDADGAYIVDTDAMATSMQEYSTILTKNSAYMFANSIVSSVVPGGGESGSGLVSRSGDTMQGALGALYGFEAGYNNTKIFETVINVDNKNMAIITGNLQVSDNVEISGGLQLSNEGIYFGETQAIWYNQAALHFSSQEIQMAGNVNVDGSIKIGNVSINANGLTFGDNEYYHSGNSNKSDVSWAMKDANVNGALQVEGESRFNGRLYSNAGFTLSALSQNLLYSEGLNDNTPFITMNSDLSIVNGHGIKVNGDYAVWIRNTDTISFSAPNRVLNLGDKVVDSDGNDIATKYISIQADIKNNSGAYTMVSCDGSGNFPNGFSAGAANALGATFQTYYTNSADYGVVSKKHLRFGPTGGPSIYSEGTELDMSVPFSYMQDGLARNVFTGLSIQAASSSSLVCNPLAEQSVAAIQFNTDGVQFLFKAPVESSKFVVESAKYKTRLEEDVLFFDDSVFIEGLTNGVRMAQNTMFDGGLYSFDTKSSSISFSSGFAGSGWAIIEDATVGGTHATFDSLTIRKKMRVYEWELQKISVTNGSLWVSDSCSGDEVRELN